MRKSSRQHLCEIKENIPLLKNLPMPPELPLQQQINRMIQQIPYDKKCDVLKMCESQEQRVYNNLHRQRYNLLNEIKSVNPSLHKELRDIKVSDLSHKLEQYKQINDVSDYDCTLLQMDAEIVYSDVKNGMYKKCYASQRNLMDEYDSDAYINKYFDLN